jgi:hypothetical protein
MPALAHGLSSSIATNVKRAAAPLPLNDRKGPRMTRPRSVYPNREAYELVIFDVRIPDVAELLHRERAAWQEHGDIEALDEGHFVLVVRPGGLRRWVA